MTYGLTQGAADSGMIDIVVDLGKITFEETNTKQAGIAGLTLSNISNELQAFPCQSLHDMGVREGLDVSVAFTLDTPHLNKVDLTITFKVLAGSFEGMEISVALSTNGTKLISRKDGWLYVAFLEGWSKAFFQKMQSTQSAEENT